MSNNKEINTDFLQELSELISENSKKIIQEKISDLHVADIGELIKNLSIEQAHYLFQLLDEEKSALVLMEVEEEVREQLLSNLSSKEIATEVIENLESDDATDVIS